MRLAIVGCRDYEDWGYFEKWVLLIIINELDNKVDKIVTGDASGADRMARDFAKKYGYPFEVFEAHWTKYGKPAGPMRNTQIVDNSDFVIAFWDSQSRGTRDTIRKAEEKLGEENVMIVAI